MKEFWAVFVVIVLIVVVYGMISSKLKERRRRKAREKALPYVGVDDTIRVGIRYDVQLSDGRRFESIEILGTTDPQDGQFPLGGWEGLLVCRLESGKKAYVRQTSVRCVIEV